MAKFDQPKHSRQIRDLLRLIAVVAVVLLAAAGTLLFVRNFDAMVRIFTASDPAA